MKKVFVNGFTGLFFTWSITSITYAQNLTNNIAKAEIQTSFENIISIPEHLNSAKGPDYFFRYEINTKAVRSFIGEYKNAENAEWFKYDKGFAVYGTMNGINTKVLYDSKGNYECMIQSYFENKLPLKIRRLIKRVYYDFSIFHVSEIRLNDKTIYIVTIEDRTSWKKIKVADEEVKVLFNYSKS